VPDASLDDGLLDVVYSAQTPKREFLACLPKSFKGTHVDHPSFSVRRARSVTFDADRPFTVYADGDPIADLPCTITVAPRALRVLAP
jgi:diacylglycerol kinase family enzyme